MLIVILNRANLQPPQGVQGAHMMPGGPGTAGPPSSEGPPNQPPGPGTFPQQANYRPPSMPPQSKY